MMSVYLSSRLVVYILINCHKEKKRVSTLFERVLLRKKVLQQFNLVSEVALQATLCTVPIYSNGLVFLYSL